MTFKRSKGNETTLSPAAFQFSRGQPVLCMGLSREPDNKKRNCFVWINYAGYEEGGNRKHFVRRQILLEGPAFPLMRPATRKSIFTRPVSHGSSFTDLFPQTYIVVSPRRYAHVFLPGQTGSSKCRSAVALLHAEEK